MILQMQGKHTINISILAERMIMNTILAVQVKDWYCMIKL